MKKKKGKINKTQKNKYLGEFSWSVLTIPLDPAGFIITLQAATQKYRARGSAACILQFKSIFLQVSLYAVSHFPTLSGSSILLSTLSSSTFNLLLRLFLNTAHKKHVHYSFVYFNLCIPREKILNRQLAERNSGKRCPNSNRSWLHGEYEFNFLIWYNPFSCMFKSSNMFSSGTYYAIKMMLHISQLSDLFYLSLKFFPPWCSNSSTILIIFYFIDRAFWYDSCK